MQSTSANDALCREMIELMPALRRLSYRFIQCESDADDLVQEVLRRAYEHLDRFAPGTSMKSWMFTIMRNVYCNRYKAAKREFVGMRSDTALQDVSIQASQDWEMRAIDVNAAILRLSAPEREALMLVSAGVSYIDAARSGRCEIGTIKSRVSRARRHLAGLLGDADLWDAATTC